MDDHRCAQKHAYYLLKWVMMRFAAYLVKL